MKRIHQSISCFLMKKESCQALWLDNTATVSFDDRQVATSNRTYIKRSSEEENVLFRSIFCSDIRQVHSWLITVVAGCIFYAHFFETRQSRCWKSAEIECYLTGCIAIQCHRAWIVPGPRWTRFDVQLSDHRATRWKSPACNASTSDQSPTASECERRCLVSEESIFSTRSQLYIRFETVSGWDCELVRLPWTCFDVQTLLLAHIVGKVVDHDTGCWWCCCCCCWRCCCGRWHD